MGSRGQVRGNLPVEVSNLVGRRADLLGLRRQLSGSRLVTVTGPGGVGKSRLTVRLGTELGRMFPDGVWLVELAALHDPAVLPHLVADALGVRDDGAPGEVGALTGFLRDRRLMLILDNCEHLLDACAQLLTVLLQRSPGLRALVTSREALRMAGEHVYPVAPLAVPEPGVAATATVADVLARYPAVALFAERAAAARPGFRVTGANLALVADVCARLDGIPLGIKLAAVGLYTLSLEQLADRLARSCRLPEPGLRAGARHSTQVAAVAWSYELCTEAERRLWDRASVFAGDFDLVAAVAVAAGDDLPGEQILEFVAGLVEKSILAVADRDDRAGQRRYRLLEVFRRYGAERLAAGAERGRTARRHRDHYLALAEEADADWFGPRQVEWLERLHRDQANLRAALEYCLDTPGEEETGLRLAAVLWMHWNCAGFVGEGRYWLDKALDRNPGPSLARVAALQVSGVSAVMQGDAAGGRARFEQALAEAEQLGDPVALAYSRKHLGVGHFMTGATATAVRYLRQALEQFAALGLRDAKALSTSEELGLALSRQGDFNRAEQLCTDLVKVCEAHGDLWVRGYAFLTLVVVAVGRGDHARAVALARDCLAIQRRLGNTSIMAQLIELIAGSTAERGGAGEAAVLYGAADSLWRTTGRPLFGRTGIDDRQEEHRELARTALGDAGYEETFTRGAALGRDEAVDLALGGPADEDAASPCGDPAGTAVALSHRERDVAGLVAAGMTNREIAETLVIAQRTAEGHVEHIMAKLGLTSRIQIAAWRDRRGDGPAGRG